MNRDEDVSLVISKRIFKLFPYVEYIAIYTMGINCCTQLWFRALLEEINGHAFRYTEQQLQIDIKQCQRGIQISSEIQDHYRVNGWRIARGRQGVVSINYLSDS